MDNVLISSGSAAVLAAYLLQYLKNAAWFPWLGIEQAKEKANLIASVLVAGVAAFGIHFTYNPTDGQLVITGLTLVGIAHGLGHWAAQWVAQHVSYKAFVVPTELLAAGVNALKQLITLLQAQQAPKG